MFIMQASLGFTPQLLFSRRALHPSVKTVTTVVPQCSHNAHLMSSAILSGKKNAHPINNRNICFLGINWTSSCSLVAEVPCVTSRISYKKTATVYFSGRLLSQILREPVGSQRVEKEATQQLHDWLKEYPVALASLE